jgi:hypothetical protein
MREFRTVTGQADDPADDFAECDSQKVMTHVITQYATRFGDGCSGLLSAGVRYCPQPVVLMERELHRPTTMEPANERLVHVAKLRRTRATSYPVAAIVTAAAIALIAAAVPLSAETGPQTLVGKAAFGDWRMDKPGTRRLIRPQDLPAADQSRAFRVAPDDVL